MPTSGKNAIDTEAREQRELLVVQAGEHLLGIFTENVAGIAAGKSPTPLPRAPASVLGVIAFRGRMLTVIDPLPLLGEPANLVGPAIMVALNGDEQLAIAADSSRGAIQISPGDIESSAPKVSSEIVTGILSRDGEQIDLLDISRLFGATMQQQERRRRRF